MISLVESREKEILRVVIYVLDDSLLKPHHKLLIITVEIQEDIKKNCMLLCVSTTWGQQIC
jgi:hypothetical protein